MLSVAAGVKPEPALAPEEKWDADGSQRSAARNALSRDIDL
jgi:hypothetical protein